MYADGHDFMIQRCLRPTVNTCILRAVHNVADHINLGYIFSKLIIKERTSSYKRRDGPNMVTGRRDSAGFAVHKNYYKPAGHASRSLGLSASQEALFPKSSASEGKILRKPLSAGAMSSLLIVYGAFDKDRRKLLDVLRVGKLSSRGSTDMESRSLRRFVVLKWISRCLRSLHCVERETRDATVVLHELSRHTLPNTATSKRGSAAAISAISSSVKLKAQSSMV